MIPLSTSLYVSICNLVSWAKYETFCFAVWNFDEGSFVAAKDSSTRATTLTPSDARLLLRPEKQASIVEAIVEAVFAAPPVIQPLLTRKILLSGGPAKAPNFAHRLYRELRANFPQSFPVNVFLWPHPSEVTWAGAAAWLDNGANFDAFCITREKYLEMKAKL